MQKSVVKLLATVQAARPFAFAVITKVAGLEAVYTCPSALDSLHALLYCQLAESLAFFKGMLQLADYTFGVRDRYCENARFRVDGLQLMTRARGRLCIPGPRIGEPEAASVLNFMSVTYESVQVFKHRYIWLLIASSVIPFLLKSLRESQNERSTVS